MLNLYQPFWHKLAQLNFDAELISQLKQLTEEKLIAPIQGDYPRWYQAYNNLPVVEGVKIDTASNAITCTSDNAVNLAELTCTLMQLSPWRKGPFALFACAIDAEWQSFMKWNRIAAKIPNLSHKLVLDVGCGNGYYMFRMLQHNPLLVMGIDPGLLQIMQFWSVEKYLNCGNAILPLTLENMPQAMQCFDVVFSMGVLYHRKSPIQHILELANTLKVGGQLVLETLVIDGDENTCLLPTGRYAQMKNVWFIPSVAMLKIMLHRNGFINITCIDICVTTINEQRSTKWMKFHSLAHFLNQDHSKTIEGYPLPTRATLMAEKK